MVLKSHSKIRKVYKQDYQCLADKIKLVVNLKNEIVLTTTTLTVLRDDNDSYEIESLELS